MRPLLNQVRHSHVNFMNVGKMKHLEIYYIKSSLTFRQNITRYVWQFTVKSGYSEVVGPMVCWIHFDVSMIP